MSVPAKIRFKLTNQHAPWTSSTRPIILDTPIVPWFIWKRGNFRHVGPMWRKQISTLRTHEGVDECRRSGRVNVHFNISTKGLAGEQLELHSAKFVLRLVIAAF